MESQLCPQCSSASYWFPSMQPKPQFPLIRITHSLLNFPRNTVSWIFHSYKQEINIGPKQVLLCLLAHSIPTWHFNQLNMFKNKFDHIRREKLPRAVTTHSRHSKACLIFQKFGCCVYFFSFLFPVSKQGLGVGGSGLALAKWAFFLISSLNNLWIWASV